MRKRKKAYRTTLFHLVQLIQDCTYTDAEVVAAVAHLVSAGRIKLAPQFDRALSAA